MTMWKRPRQGRLLTGTLRLLWGDVLEHMLPGALFLLRQRLQALRAQEGEQAGGPNQKYCRPKQDLLADRCRPT